MFYITQKNWDKILGYAEEAYETEKSEIGGMSVMVEDKDGDWVLQDPVILKQEISSGNTVLEKEALAIYYTKQAKKMGKRNFRFCWWHSHHTMSAFWSSTDKIAIDEFDEGDFSFALVVNLKGEYKFRVSIWKPFAIHEDTELEILHRQNRCTKKMKEEVENLCSTPVNSLTDWKKNSYNYGYRYGGYQNENQLNAAKDPRQERLSFNATTRASVYTENRMSFSNIVEEVDDFNSDLIAGTIKYKVYVESIENLNTSLEKEDSLYRVNIIKEAQKDDLLHVLPAQLVVYTTGDDVADLYNHGYGWDVL